EYSEYKMIIEGASRLEAPSFDRQKIFDGIKEKTPAKKEVKAKRLIPNWVYGAAAAIVLFLGYMFMFNETNYTAGFGQKIAFNLPDDSEVQLNSGSKVSFDPGSWADDRSLTLDGEAFFKVKKGATFTVNTKEGKVTVLGTQFTVNSRNGLYQVKCYEGKVSVSVDGKEAMLELGDAVLLQDGSLKKQQFEAESPEWLSGETRFNNIPILQVVEEIERQYGVTILGKKNLNSDTFTGRFTHNDLDQTLKTVFVAMEIPYTFDGNTSVSILK
ncbi:MAG: FecR domain-containing protein, partial [Flavobacteriaceae bacterium]|nr:FecR domain-containing protein [Flavobacteriaceae bacterium]